MFWSGVVLKKSGKSVTDLDHLFGKAKGESGPVSGLWRKYYSGESSPVHGGKKKSLVDLVEEKFPDTRKWYEHPLWTALEPRAFSSVDLRELYSELGQPVQSWFLEDTGVGPFWKKVPSPKLLDLVELKRGISGIDAMAALVLEMRFYENAQNEAAHFKATLFAVALCDRLCKAEHERKDLNGQQIYILIFQALLLQVRKSVYRDTASEDRRNRMVDVYEKLFNSRQNNIYKEMFDKSRVRELKLSSKELRALEDVWDEIWKAADYGKDVM